MKILLNSLHFNGHAKQKLYHAGGKVSIQILAFEGGVREDQISSYAADLLLECPVFLRTQSLSVHHWSCHDRHLYRSLLL